jgi:hypothetical protein
MAQQTQARFADCFPKKQILALLAEITRSVALPVIVFVESDFRPRSREKLGSMIIPRDGRGLTAALVPLDIGRAASQNG